MAGKRLYRSRDGRLLFGVCGGIAEYLNVDPTIVRLLWLLSTLMGGPTPWIAYVVLVFVVPLESAAPDPGATKKLEKGEAPPEAEPTSAPPAETKKLEE